MKKKYAIVITALIVCIQISMSSYKTSGGHPGTTGAPGEPTCAQSGCHSDATVNDGVGVNTLIFPNADSTYTPGQTYTVTVQVNKPSISKFGFELGVLKDADNTSIGQLTVTDANRTHLINATINSKSRTYITHSTNGTPATSSGKTSWSFQWKAPSTNVGNITFYYVTNNTNSSNTNTGDALYLSSFTIKAKTSGTSIKELSSEESFKVFLSSSNQLQLNYELRKNSQISAKLCDIQGKVIETIELGEQGTGKHTDYLNLNHEISSGIYFVNLTINNQTISKKVLVQ